MADGPDANKVLQLQGEAELRRRFDRAAGDSQTPLTLTHGSDQDVAGCIAADLQVRFGEVVHAEGAFHAWRGTHWAELMPEQLHPFISKYDGAAYRDTNNRVRKFSLNKTRHTSILYLLRHELEAPGFFEMPALGLACRSGFLAVDAAGHVRCLPHSPEQKTRHMVVANWRPELDGQAPEGSLLNTLLAGCFQGDAEADKKRLLLGELTGAAAFGLGTRLTEPKAVILLGESAGNGKSQMMKAIGGLLPASAVSAITPAELAREQRRAQLAGKLLNAADELGPAAIRSDTFKAVVTGDTVSGKTVYKVPAEFRPCALHVFSTNMLPPFQEDMDRGVRRRLQILTFDRTIPAAERIAGIGEQIAANERDLLLAFAVVGAQRLIRQGGFTETRSGQEKLASWVLMSDAVAAFFRDADAVSLTGADQDRVTSKAAYSAFQVWAKREGLLPAQVPTHTQFTMRAKALDLEGLTVRRHAKGTLFKGSKLLVMGT